MLKTALSHHQKGRLDEAAALYRKIIAQNPKDADAIHLLGVIELQTSSASTAIELFDRAIEVNPKNADFFYNRGIALGELKRFEDALVSYDRALAIKPDHAEAINNRGATLRVLKRFDEAIASYDHALAIKPDHDDALNNRGIALGELKRFEDALVSYDRALAIKPDNIEALNNRGAALRLLKRFDEALASYDHALAIKPDYVEALNNRGIVLGELERVDEALASYDQALAIRPNYVEAHHNRGNVLIRLKRYEEAAHDFERVLGIDPEHDYALGQFLHARMHCCDWSAFESTTDAVEAGVRTGKRTCMPFAFQAISSSPADLQVCSQIFTANVYPPATPFVWRGERYDHDRIRIGYVSGEFREQATSYLMAGLFELHDMSRFEIRAFDNGYDDHSPMRKRLESALGGFIDISRQSDGMAAKSIREREIDILIDLNGFFGLERRGVFALRPAPLQVNCLGVPATLGAEYIDYIIADRIVIPEEEQRYYNEKVVYLPDSYQVNDSKRRIAELTLTRAEAGLPEAGFVFCSFNSSYKFTPTLFDVWMRLLRAVEGSVMWLLKCNETAENNLRREAEARGVSAERLMFAPFAKLEDHLARQRLGDLFLNSLPYNAHTTASDALWAGLPVVTCAGSAFPGRVAASLLTALNLPELIACSLTDYEALALHFARNPVALASVKTKLARNRLTMPLFNTDRYRSNLEAAFVAMWERHRQGLPPEGFVVPSMEGLSAT